MQFHKAERKKAKLRLALSGPSGSGKTMSALLIAKGIGGRVALIDMESGSGGYTPTMKGSAWNTMSCSSHRPTVAS